LKIGVFDSGLGGLLIARSIIHELPEHDVLYLGDTARVPYGTRSRDTIHRFTVEAVDYLFRHDCRLIIVACNTASADALRRVQQEYLPIRYPDRRVLGVLIPAAEAAVDISPPAPNNGGVEPVIGVLATQATVTSGAFVREVTKLRPNAHIVQQAAPLLVPLIEMGGVKYARPIVDEYVRPLLDAGMSTLILGCTHYPLIRDMIQEAVGPGVAIVDQNDVVPNKLLDYLRRHPEIDAPIGRTGTRVFQVTDFTHNAEEFARQLFPDGIELELIDGLG
jgi:glutamate racemase